MSAALDIINGIDAIGTVPTAVAQIFGMINDPKATMADFERVVRPDAGLTANLLRSANSAYYRGAREITSVREAIMRMGMRRVFEVAAGASFAKAIPPSFKGYGITAETYWAHSVAVAVLSDRIGREVGFTYPDLAFTAGLLHDLGKVVVASWLEANPAVQVEAEGLKTVQLEAEVIGATHPELGEALCSKWNLPKDIGGAGRWHHNPEDAPTSKLRHLANLVWVADCAANAAGFGSPERESYGAESLEVLSLDEARLAGIVEAARPEVLRTQELLRAAAG